MIDNKRNFAKKTVARKKRLEARRLAVTLSDDAAPSLQIQPIFLDLLTFPNDWAYDREKSLNQKQPANTDVLFQRNDERKYVAHLSYPKGPDVCVIYQKYCVTTLIIRNHSDDAAYFTFIELTSSVPLADLLVEIFIKALNMGHYSKASEKPLLTGSTFNTRLSYPKGPDVWVIQQRYGDIV